MIVLSRIWLFLVFDICGNVLQVWFVWAAWGQYLAIAAMSSPREVRRSLQWEQIIFLSVWGKEMLGLGKHYVLLLYRWKMRSWFCLEMCTNEDSGLCYVINKSCCDWEQYGHIVRSWAKLLMQVKCCGNAFIMCLVKWFFTIINNRC